MKDVFIASPRASALEATDYISKVKLYAPDCGNHNNDAHTTIFNVDLTWGPKCKGVCTKYGYWTCQTPKVDCPSGTFSNYSVKLIETSEKYKYYRVYINTGSGLQDVAGHFKEKLPTTKHSLEMFAWNSTFGGWLSEAPINSCTSAGGSCTVSAPTVWSYTPYYVIWPSDTSVVFSEISCPGGEVDIVPWRCTIKKLTSDVDAVAHYITTPYYVNVYAKDKNSGAWLKTQTKIEYTYSLPQSVVDKYAGRYGARFQMIYGRELNLPKDYSKLRSMLHGTEEISELEDMINEIQWCSNNADNYKQNQHNSYAREEYDEHHCYRYETKTSTQVPASVGSGSGYYGWNVGVNAPTPLVADNSKSYNFIGWENCSDGYAVNSGTQLNVPSGSSCTIYNITGVTSLVALYGTPRFSGRARVSEKDTGYVESGSTGTAEVDCSSDDGCDVAYYFDIKDDYNVGNSTNYTIKNSDGSVLKSGSISPGNGTNVYSGTFRLAINETKCITMDYNREPGVVRTMTACAHVKPTYFEGRSIVSNTTVSDTTVGYTRENGSSSTAVINCPASGCSVTFNHALRRSNSTGGTDYTISRTSNLTATNKGISNNSNIASGRFNAGEQTVNTNTLTLYPGMRVCEQLYFRPNNEKNTDNMYIEICAYAAGNAQPDGDSNYIDILVKNENGSAQYQTYQKTVYAKPNDTVRYETTYNPVLQYTYYLIPSKARIDGGDISDNSNNAALGNFYNNSIRGSRQQWNNAYGVEVVGITGITPISHGGRNLSGNASKQTNESETYKINPMDVGYGSVYGRAFNNIYRSDLSRYNANIQMTPRQVSFSYDGPRGLANISTASSSSRADVRVPYNFTNTTAMTIPTSRTYYAGETGTIGTTLQANPRRNNTTNGTYATIVRGVRWKFRICYNGTCQETAEQGSSSTVLNATGNVNGSEDYREMNVNIPDLPAGSQICFSSAIYPADSGDETNWQNSAGNGGWSAWSTPACFNVAKKPSLQAWGGNVFSAAAINAQRAVKHNLKGYSSYNINAVGPQKTWVFGSWGELGVVSQRMITGFGSGATLGFASNSNGVLSPSLSPNPPEGNTVANTPNAGGSNDASFCKQSILTFTNSPCSSSSSSINGSDGKDAADSINANIASIESLAGINEKGEFISSNIKYQDITESNFIIDGGMISGMDDKTVLYRKTGDLVVEGGNLLRGTFKVVVATGNIRITKDIMIEGGETFENFRQVPKAVVYSNDTIAIDCGVKRLDAILVAKNRVVTCGDNLNLGESLGKQIVAKINSRANSNQLVVNGAILTGRLYANRTYGAAAGANSIVPAEVINFDPTLYLWGGIGDTGEDNDTNDNVNMEVTYIHELAPRY
ncbi:hypothetical protein IKE82_00615 [Candidatus Saccharibacteria bacterium]|nr:hypothetical protein [Candidatus Saccharibacteria bacterium]